MKNIFFLALTLVLTHGGAQNTFALAVGGPSKDESIYGVETSDGGFVTVGWTQSYGAGGWDIYLIKTDARGELLWTRTYGGPAGEVDCSVTETTDGGFIISARTGSYGEGDTDVFLIKTASDGTSEWTKTIGGKAYEEGHCIIETKSGNYVHCGYTTSFGAGGDDIYLMLHRPDGSLVFAKTFGGSGTEHGHLMTETADGGFAIVGTTTSFGAGNYDVYLLKTDSLGNLLWSKTFGGAANEDGWGIKATADGGFILTGYTKSFGAGEDDLFLIKTDANGNQQWCRAYGNTNTDLGYSVELASDGGFIIGGITLAPGKTTADVYLVKTDANGNPQWSRTYGGDEDDGCQSIVATKDGGYFISGYTTTFGAGDWDFYLIKTDNQGKTSSCLYKDPVTLSTPFMFTTSNAQTKTSVGGVLGSPVCTQMSGGVANLCSLITGIEEKNNAQLFSIAPNPAANELFIKWNDSSPGENAEYTITDMNGRQVVHAKLNSGNPSIDVSSLANGIYLCRIGNENKMSAPVKVAVYKE
jgi:hypothetical protein